MQRKMDFIIKFCVYDGCSKIRGKKLYMINLNLDLSHRKKFKIGKNLLQSVIRYGKKAILQQQKKKQSYLVVIL